MFIAEYTNFREHFDPYNVILNSYAIACIINQNILGYGK